MNLRNMQKFRAEEKKIIVTFRCHTSDEVKGRFSLISSIIKANKDNH